MRTFAHRRAYSLVELLVVLAIVAILATLAVAGYGRYVRESRRLDARAALVALAAAQERHYLEHGRYASVLQPVPIATGPGIATAAQGADDVAGSPPDVLWFADPATAAHYALAIVQADALGYRLEARATGAQRGDAECRRFELDSHGLHAAADAAGGDTTRRCWG